MGTYEVRLREMGKMLLKALAIGLVISAIFVAVMNDKTGFEGVKLVIFDILGTIYGGIIVCFPIAVLCNLKSGLLPKLLTTALGCIKSILWSCVAYLVTLNPLMIVPGVFGMMISLGLGSVVVVFGSWSLPLNFIYLAVMTVLERTGHAPDAEKAELLDMLVPAVCTVITIWVIVSFIIRAS